MLLAMFLLQRHRLIGLRSSGTLFIFWMLMVIYGSFKLRTYILVQKFGVKPQYKEAKSTYYFVTTVLNFVWFLGLFIFNCVQDKKPLYSPVDDDSNPCPENDASFLSIVSFWWLNGLIWTGFRRPLEQSDLWSLMPDDKSAFVVPRFLYEWRKERDKAKRYLGGRASRACAILRVTRTFLPLSLYTKSTFPGMLLNCRSSRLCRRVGSIS
ncbi:ATP-binding cassette sub-family C member 3-like isoform X2 [Corticium candelabrum]|uniref:ATP-binding cassette sub-family C member 3-like isoform X2 n=1 Tax=Corticium candelabrum TaxID=121492 RepID=UPI002E26B302|nr:ATP-binding cassette sub-family C member 3-like isoform X2 [Corticium candelabrum]